MKLIELKNISKSYQLHHKEPLLTTAMLRRLTRFKQETFWALQDISLEIEKGESIGIIGENGSGKSTLLRILTGVTVPTTGTKQVRGRIGSLLELGAGFHPYLTGKENIFLNAAILGMKKSRVKELFPQIVDFADIGKFIDTPVSTYSDGMYLRLGFSVAVHLDVDVLIVDEVLAVGDEEFQHKCLVKVNELLSQGKSLVIVSHDLNLIRTVCNKVGWLHGGKFIGFGNPNQMTGQYLLDVSKRQGMAIIDNFPLTVVFQKGKLLIFWHGIELTKNLCGYTSLFSIGSWQDSTQAQWKVTHTGNKITATGTWFKIPVIQTWKIEVGKNNIMWQINLEVTEPFRIDHETINLMLSENFTNWQMYNKKDQFPSEFSSDFWSRSIQDTEKPSISLFSLNSQQGYLPKISFLLDSPSNNFIGVVANTDRFYRARVIQYERKRKETLYLPDKDYHFRGTIKIE